MSTAWRHRLTRPVAGVLIALAWVSGLGFAGPPSKPKDKDIILSRLVNPEPAFQVVIEVDRAERVYHEGEEIKPTVVSEAEGYLYVFSRSSAGDWYTLFPNDLNKDNKIKANTPVKIPGDGFEKKPGDGYRTIVAGPSFGRELIKAVVTRQPLDPKDAGAIFMKKVGTPVNANDKDTASLKIARSVAMQKGPTTPPQSMDIVNARAGQIGKPLDDVIDNKDKLKDWAEASIEVVTMPKGGKPEPIPPIPLPGPKPDPNPPAKFGRRIGIFIGISKYDQKVGKPVGNLQVADKDATTFAEVAKKEFKLDEVAVLVNEQATKKAIEEVITAAKDSAPNPNDLVIIFWSGHGGQCANTRGPGVSQYLVPHDGDLSKENDSMVSDDEFGEWVKRLSGRKVLVLLDACHSAGQIANPVKGTAPKQKGLEPVKALPGLKGQQPKLFIKKQMDTLKLLKKVDQADAMVIASSAATEPSLERPEGDLSVFTYYLVERINKDAGDLAPKDLYEHVKVEVPKYVTALFAGKMTQEPSYGGSITPDSFKLRAK